MSRLSALVDVRPLRDSADFRRLWVGTTAAGFGNSLTTFAVVYSVWESTRNPAVVGAIGLAVAAPLVVFALLGGTFADRVDRRRLVVLTTWGQVITSAAMAVLAARQVDAVWPLFVLVGISSALSAVGTPARKTFIPLLLPRQRVQAGLALNQMSFQITLLLGPVAAGAITAAWGTTPCFAIDAVTFLAALHGVAALPSAGRPATQIGPAHRAIWQGFRLVARTPALRGAFLVDLCATVLAMPMALFPVINQEKFGGSPQTLGLFMSAVAVGGLVATALSGLITHGSRPGRVLLASGAVWGAALAAVGLVDSLPGVLLLLGVAGAADTWTVISRGTIVQLATPESHRGRVTSMEYVVGAAGPQLGGFRAGLVAAASSGSGAIVSGGLLCLAGLAVITARLPQLRTFTTTRVGATTNTQPELRVD